MAKKKILFIVEAMGGGVFSYIVDLANKLAETDEMFVAYAVRNQTPQDYKEYFNKRVHLIRVKNFQRKINILKDIKACAEIREIANHIKPDVIHLHSSKAGALGRLVLIGQAEALFYTPHGYSFLMQDCNPLRQRIYRGIEFICAKRRCTTISCSPGEHRETLKLTRNAVCVNNGINVEQLQKIIDETKKVPHAFTVFTLGRICYQKNPVLFNQIAEAMPEVRFVWIGDGEMRKQLKSPNIEITGWTDRKEAIRYAVNGDVFILTSRWEGMPFSLLEAMCMKKPCVVSNIIGNQDVIHDKENGFICQTGQSFIEAIKYIQRGDTFVMVENAYQDILKSYNTTVMAERYRMVYVNE